MVEGPQAGGHLGFTLEQLGDPAHALEVLLAEVLREIAPFETRARRPIPVIVGGGIYTGADIHHFLQRGRMDHRFAFAGANAPRATAIVSVKGLVATLLEEYHAAAA